MPPIQYERPLQTNPPQHNGSLHDSRGSPTPDYLLITKTGPLVVDVTPTDKLNEPVVADTLAWTRAAIEGRGWSYEGVERGTDGRVELNRRARSDGALDPVVLKREGVHGRRGAGHQSRQDMPGCHLDGALRAQLGH